MRRISGRVLGRCECEKGQRYDQKHLKQNVILAQKPGMKLEDAWVQCRIPAEDEMRG